ncbi:MAG TPA: hypothetical protein VL176_10820 [Steroidobacteraceae bacterium]|jgi:hypothetical protein|nr:hypothetical protein [Steroidobacteraceae bacterium]
MRATMYWVFALLAIAALRDASSLHSTRSVCATKADQTSLAAHSKANSFAPHPGAHSRVYGVPIQSRILKSRPKKNPQLKSTALPDA